MSRDNVLKIDLLKKIFFLVKKWIYVYFFNLEEMKHFCKDKIHEFIFAYDKIGIWILARYFLIYIERGFINTSRFYECDYNVAINQAACAWSPLIADYSFMHTSLAFWNDLVDKWCFDRTSQFAILPNVLFSSPRKKEI